MKKHILALGILAAVATSVAQAGTYLYQPTPYPKKKFSGADMPQDLKIVHFWEGTRYACSWCNVIGVYNFLENDILRIGGWGDYYMPIVKFDLAGLPKDVTGAYLYLNAIPSGSPLPSQVAWCRITSSWDLSTIGGYAQPTADSCYVTAPTTATGWRGYPITNVYNQWQNGSSANNGMIFFPNNNDGQQRFDHFVSSRNADATKRPQLLLQFEPTLQLKMPLPSGYLWLLTNETGGYECLAKEEPWPDLAHQGKNHSSIDISARDSGYSGDIPVLAALGGKVISGVNAGSSPSGPNFPNGNYIVIDHDGDGNPSTGFQTWYLHLKNAPSRADNVALVPGDIVAQGDRIGIMGTTGTDSNGNPTSTAVHLHFGVRYKNSGDPTVSPEISKVVMEDMLLKSYQTECSVNAGGTPTDWVKKYQSTMTPTGR